jgi:hypothetical protein
MRTLMIRLSLSLMAATWAGCSRKDTKNAAADTARNGAATARSRPAESPLKILSALRTERYVDPTHDWKAKDDERDLILVVEFAGISSAVWEKVPGEQVYLEAAGERHRPEVTKTVSVMKGDWELEKVVLVVVVPRNVLEFELHVGDLPTRTVKVDAEIKAELRAD